MDENASLDDTSKLPDWAEEILSRHNLWTRTDELLGAVIVLLTDAANLVKAISMKAFEDQALSAETVRRVEESSTNARRPGLCAKR